MWEIQTVRSTITLLYLTIATCKPDVLLDCGNDLICRKIYSRSWDKINNLMMVMQEVDHPSEGLTTLVNPSSHYLVHHGVVLAQPLLALVPSPHQSGYSQESWPKRYRYRPPPGQRYVMRYGRPSGYGRPTEYYVRKPTTDQGYHVPQEAPKVEFLPSLSYSLPTDITTFHPPDFSQNYLVDASTETAPRSFGREGDAEDGVPYSSRSYASVQYFHPSSAPLTAKDLQEEKRSAEASKEEAGDPTEASTVTEKAVM